MPNDMRDALDLTRAGRLGEATDVILKRLGAKRPAVDAGSRESGDGRGPARKPWASPRAGSAQRSTPRPAALQQGGPRAAAVRAFAKRGGATPDVPAGCWEWRTHSGPHGSRRYRLFVPAGVRGPASLVVMLHGCTQDPDDFAAGTRILAAAAERGLVVALPEQTRESNAMGCWNWFERTHQGTRGEAAILAGIVNDTISGERIDRSRIVVAGLSAGGAMAAVLGEAYPELFTGVGVHSGLPTGAAHDLSSAMTAMRGGPSASPSRRSRTASPQRLFVMHGDADTTVSPRNADALLERARGGADAVTERREGTTRIVRLDRADGSALAEVWRVPGLGHAWSGGARGASYTAPNGPDATGAMLDFLLA